jgi:hypothetical protein
MSVARASVAPLATDDEADLDGLLTHSGGGRAVRLLFPPLTRGTAGLS